MGGKSGAKRKGKKSGNPQKRGQGRPAGGVRNDYRGADFANSHVVANGTMAVKTYVQQYAPVPTALDALPQPPAGFTGREDDLAYILGVLDPDRTDGPAVAVLSGWGGVGKTTLAYASGHAAQERGWYTGVLLVDLHGYDPYPAQAEDALEALLRSLGVRPEHLPPPGAGREALYRSQLNARQEAGERLLVVADNASAVAQVQPLLPPGHHGMLVTSRHRLTGLGRMRTVNSLQPEDAVALLEAALKNNDPDDVRVEQEPEAAERVASACGYLPLALQITAALLAQDPGQPLTERADALGDAEGILDGLSDGERSLRTMFDQSLERLSLQEQDLFRQLSLNPGPDISTAAASALADQPQPATERLLARLAVSHLIERNQVARDRWQMHDLLRAYANEQAAAAVERGRAPRRRYEQAHERLIDHYVQHAKAADTYFRLSGNAETSRFRDQGQALAWFDAERENLIAAAHIGLRAGLDLGFALGSYLHRRRRLQDLVVVRALALNASQTISDTDRTAGAWNNLGVVLRELRRFDESLDAHQKALRLSQQNSGIHNQATAWDNLGSTLQELRRLDEALHAHQTALSLRHRAGNIRGQVSAWNNLGLALRGLRRFDEALHAHQTALSLCQQPRNTHQEATVWNNLGLALQELGRLDEALLAYGTARGFFEQTEDIHGVATSNYNLSTAYRGLGRFDEALAAGRLAVDMLTTTQDWFRTGEAWGAVATTLSAAATDPSQVREAWEQSAAAYTRAGADEKAAASQTNADDS
ncbi:tetratricopeptide repeat protein [Streptomyces cyaneofuscatus]|uniref:tetratricopeptide repeat protein n=1 Tax=Streptomyces TaxID=1883 RepID=UPI001929AFD6|nr:MULTISPECIES: tetratricopeptide repeat protein [unclassified Streptomyces]CAD5949888.1 TPR_REGION domain-containing protein [Streptomyces sp. KY70]CAD5985045.1 TPR_REGION domain-containing protein [Streptomyces sp. KY75]